MTVETRAIPGELTVLRQWVNWALEQREGKTTKVPYICGTGRKASSTDPSTWRPFADAAADRQRRGIGFVFCADDPYTGVDLDHCRDPETGFVADWAQEILRDLDSYAEYSPSGAGIHVIVRAKLPPGRRQKAFGGFYDRARYFTMTGSRVPGTPAAIAERQAQLEALHARLLAEEEAPARGRAAVRSTLADDELLERARNARNGARFVALWDGNAANYDDDESRADLALCCHLAFWTGADAARIDALFRRSGLYRDKWDARRPEGTYGSMTIQKAIALTRDTYRPARPAAPPATNGHGPPAGPPEGDQSAAPRARSFPLTDLGNAERLVARFGERLRYCSAWRSWLIWDGRHWTRDETDEIERLAKATVRSVYDEAGLAEDEERRKAIARHALRSEGEARIRAMVALARSEPTVSVTPAMLDRDPWLLCCANGTIDLRTGELRPHERADLMTKAVPIVYTPEARLPLWDKFLADATGQDGDLAAFLARAAGYSLTGDTREEKLFFVHGPSRAGKSTFLDALKMVLGSYAATADFETFLARRDPGGPRQDIARLAAMRFVVSIEVDEGRKLAEALVKMLTGGDEVTARYLFGREFEFRPTFKLWLAANAAPRAHADDDAIWNRIVRIPFERVVVAPDPRVKLTLRDPDLAGPAILAWAVRGCLEWQRVGLKIPESVVKASGEYRLAVDRLAEFISDCCALRSDAWTPARRLLDAYANWAKSSGEKRPLQGRAFGERLTARGCARESRTIAGQTQRGWLGIALVGDDEQPELPITELGGVSEALLEK